LRRGTYIRQYEYDFIELFASQLSKKAVDMAMAGPGADDAYQL
jgi:LysR family cys regulon transcriptional activator